MDIKQLLSIVARPWFMEQGQADIWYGAAMSFLQSGVVPAFDKRSDYTFADAGDAFRLNYDGTLNNANGPMQFLRLSGPIAKYDFCGAAGSQTLGQLVASSSADTSVTVLILIIDSPGGAVDGTETLANAIKASSKPVVAFVDGMMCSAAYWIGSAATHIISDGSNNGYNATIGSIGTMATVMDFSKRMEKLGVVEHRVFADKSSDKWGDYFKIVKEGDYSGLKTLLNGLNETFLNAVQANRAGKLKLNVENVLSGKTYTATQALEFGLIDQIGTYADALAKAAELGQSYSKTTKKKNNIAMNGETIAFAAVAAAAKSPEGFSVVDGGFLATEDNLNALEAHLNATATAATTAAARITELEAQLTTATTAATTAETALATTKTELETANATIAQLQADEKSHKNAVKEYFGGTTADNDKGAAHAVDADTAAILASLPHNQQADAIATPATTTKP